jgi:hypothetical protein
VIEVLDLSREKANHSVSNSGHWIGLIPSPKVVCSPALGNRVSMVPTQLCFWGKVASFLLASRIKERP